MKTSWFKFQLVSSNGVGCSESAYIHIHIHTYIHTYIHSDSKETEGPLFYCYIFISIHSVRLKVK